MVRSGWMEQQGKAEKGEEGRDAGRKERKKGQENQTGDSAGERRGGTKVERGASFQPVPDRAVTGHSEPCCLQCPRQLGQAPPPADPCWGQNAPNYTQTCWGFRDTGTISTVPGTHIRRWVKREFRPILPTKSQ